VDTGSSFVNHALSCLSRNIRILNENMPVIKEFNKNSRAELEFKKRVYALELIKAKKQGITNEEIDQMVEQITKELNLLQGGKETKKELTLGDISEAVKNFVSFISCKQKDL